MRAGKTFLAAALVAAGLSGVILATDGLWLKAKAELAQVLLERAWNRTLAGHSSAKPWPWADMWPAFELSLPRLGEEVIVLSGASGEAMSFGPGWMTSTARPGDPGLAVIAAHRDTHFDFLKHVKKGDRLTVTRPDSRQADFEVVSMQVVDAKASGLDRHMAGTWLALSTCWPLDGTRRTQERYVVLAKKVA